MQTPQQNKRFSLKSLLPSSLVSLTVHVAILIMAGMSMKGCESSAPSAAGGQDFREIGLALINDSSDAVSNQRAQNPQDTDIQQPSDLVTKPEQQPAVPTEVPNVAEFLNQNTAQSTATTTGTQIDLSDTVGPGRPISGIPEIGGGLAELIRPRGTSGMSPAGSLTPGPGETAFMDIVGKGQSFVYVIDTSGSMIHDRRLELAKSQLKGSLQLLQPNQKFQVLFYNNSVTPINLRGRVAEDMYPATAQYLLLAVQAIDLQVPDYGTAHLPAIERALLLQPDVIYFLTDGATPALTTAELKRVRQRNRNTEIHVIEFATSAPESRLFTWLQSLAADSGGQYRRITMQ
jgi:hypothetical protein